MRYDGEPWPYATKAAVSQVCALAQDAADATLILTVLGLLEDGRLVWPRAGVLEVRDIKNVASTGYMRRSYG